MNFSNCFKLKKPILILGETGTGKSCLAKSLHTQYGFGLKYIQINIAAINKNLFESELFGHTKGSFTGAHADKEGFCEAIGAGTLFIDEIGELSLETQVKLLTLLDERIFYRVGCTKPRNFRGNIILATNIDLAKKVESGEFRKDLYFRLRFYEINLRPLRSHALIKKLILEEIEDKSSEYKNLISLDRESFDLLSKYKWPGNFRELSNTIEYLYSLDKILVKVEDLPSWIKNERLDAQIESGNYYELVDEFERNYLRDLMFKTKGKIVEAVKLSGLSKPTIISKLRKYDISRLDFKNLNYTKEAYGF